MKTVKFYDISMLSFVCRLFGALSVALALSIPTYAVETPRMLARQIAQTWPDCGLAAQNGFSNSIISCDQQRRFLVQ
jgi:hypothetical protein